MKAPMKEQIRLSFPSWNLPPLWFMSTLNFLSQKLQENIGKQPIHIYFFCLSLESCIRIFFSCSWCVFWYIYSHNFLWNILILLVKIHNKLKFSITWSPYLEKYAVFLLLICFKQFINGSRNDKKRILAQLILVL